MKKNKFIYSLSVLALACVISFSGVGGSYIQARASSGAFDVLWNTDESAWNNIVRHMVLWGSAAGVVISPNILTSMALAASATDFYNFMLADGYTEEEAEETVHGGGGHVRDGISVDDSGNVTYSDDVSDLFHGYIEYSLSDYTDYVYVNTTKISDIPVDYLSFTNSTKYHNFINLLQGLVSQGYTVFVSGDTSGTDYIYVGYDYVDNFYDYEKYYDNYLIDFYNDGVVAILKDDWTSDSYFRKGFVIDMNDCGTLMGNGDKKYVMRPSEIYLSSFNFILSPSNKIKVWFNIDSFKKYSVGSQPYYVTQSWFDYDSTVDNSMTMTSQEYNYYNDNSTTIYHTIQNNITNYDGDLDESVVKDIVDSAVQEIKDTIANMENDDNGGSDDGGSDENDGSGIGDLVGGIGKLLDTVLSLIGKVMGVVADFTQSILDLFSGFTDFTDGFSSFLSGAFAFIPIEIWNVIQVGLSLMILLAVIKFLRK